MGFAVTTVFGIWDSERDSGFGIRPGFWDSRQDSGFGIRQDSGIRVLGFQDSSFGIRDSSFRIPGFSFSGFWDSGFQDSGGGILERMRMRNGHAKLAGTHSGVVGNVSLGSVRKLN